MKSIDIHAHIIPDHARNLGDGDNWHGFTMENGSDGHNALLIGEKRAPSQSKLMYSPDSDWPTWTRWALMFTFSPAGHGCITMTCQRMYASPPRWIATTTLPTLSKNTR